MRQLWLMTGAPGSGKSTLIEKYKLSQYTLCADNIRLLCQSPVLTIDGDLAISQKNDKYVWTTLFDLLEKRMERGEFTIIDAVHSKSSDFSKYKELAYKYRYRLFYISTRDVPIEVVKERNSKRENYKKVPEAVIDNIYSRFSTQNIPNYVQKIPIEEIHKRLEYDVSKHNYSNYKKIYVIGDVHGCFTALKSWWNINGNKDSCLYIFIGDYIDRGIENAQMINFLYEIHDKKNIILLEGNHEIHLWNWANNELIKSPEFKNNTQPELEKYGIEKSKVREICRKLCQISYFTYHDQTFFISHGGVPKIPKNLITVASSQFIKGVGKYEDSNHIDEIFMKTYESKKIYQIHGHRNRSKITTMVNNNCFNLCDEVEFGGHLRILYINQEHGITGCLVKNDIFKKELKLQITPPKEATDVKELVEILRQDSLIEEKKNNLNISSFNFSRKAFFDATWNERTMTARGLFINTNTNEIVARSYPKFFNINEREDTKLDALSRRLQFPITSYFKVNGFLGIVGYNGETDELILTSKSVINGEFPDYFKRIFYSKINKEQEESIKKYVKENNCSLVFEVIDPVNDPHIIKYKCEDIWLLDIIHRTIEYKKEPYKEVKRVADNYGFKCKEKYLSYIKWEYFLNTYNIILKESYDPEVKVFAFEHEGLVFEDSNGYMFKLKTPYYQFWKYMRRCVEYIRSGKENKINKGSLFTPLHNEVFSFIKSIPRRDLYKMSIIDISDKFYSHS